MALGTAFRAFFAALFNDALAQRLKVVLDVDPATAETDSSPARLPQKPLEQTKPTSPASSRSEAITLLATLQREARLIDLVKENLSAYSDAQIGAAARPCLTQCASTLERVMTIKPITTVGEGATMEVPASSGPSRFQWLGEGSGSTGKLVHHGWEVERVELPQWTGSGTDANVIAPVQVQRT